MECGYAVELTIPDNTAFTALVTLQRLGIACDDLHRADVYLFDVDDRFAGELEETIPALETIYNPNKHRLRRCENRPAHGEVWITDVQGGVKAASGGLHIAGRELPGVRALCRFTAWRLTANGQDVPENVLRAAVEALLCNPAYQKAVR